jgi:N-acetylglucosaminyldiphosphoundecaprenol N-acetyl-beta-D-mannosaminyltransferase
MDNPEPIIPIREVSVAGLKVTTAHSSEIIRLIKDRMIRGVKTFITTPYSEFLLAARQDPAVMEMLNHADVAIADGIGIIWAAKYLSLANRFHVRWLRFIQATWQMKYSILAIIFNRPFIFSVVPAKIVGADFAWELAMLAEANGWSIYLLGGFGDTSELATAKLVKRYPRLRAKFSNKNPDDPSVLTDIQSAKPDILMVAYGPIRQEKWIMEHWSNLPVRTAIGLGGTFDYIAGKRANPPRWLRYTGLEWLFRLITQPKRIKRIYRATFGLIWEMVRYKVNTVN